MFVSLKVMCLVKRVLEVNQFRFSMLPHFRAFNLIKGTCIMSFSVVGFLGVQPLGEKACFGIGICKFCCIGSVPLFKKIAASVCQNLTVITLFQATKNYERESGFEPDVYLTVQPFTTGMQSDCLVSHIPI